MNNGSFLLTANYVSRLFRGRYFDLHGKGTVHSLITYFLVHSSILMIALPI